MREQFIRTEMLLGAEALARLQRARVALFGLGGVGGYALEALARSGIGQLDLIDNDTVSVSNLNRQILATHSTVGMPKVEAGKRRVLDINPDCVVRTYPLFYTPDTAGTFDFSQYDYVVDAIDTVTGKLALVQQAHDVGVPIISCMGTGNKLHPELLEVQDISRTRMCPLARVMRRELKNRGIDALRVVYSPEEPIKPLPLCDVEGRRAVPGSVSFVPGAAGLMAAGEAIRFLAQHSRET